MVFVKGALRVSVRSDPDVVVLRKGTEGLGMDSYADELRSRLPEFEVIHAKTPLEEERYGSRARVLTGESVSPRIVTENDRMQLFACTFAGVDHLPLGVLREENVIVTNASGIHAVGIAEQVIGSFLLFARGLRAGMGNRSGRERADPVTRSLEGSQVTIVGLGAIGSAIATRLEGFGVTRTGIRHTPEKGGAVERVIGYDRNRVLAVLAETDYVVLACPLTDLTRGLLDEEAFSVLPPSAVIANVARGKVIETNSLVTALETDQIAGAYLDVTDPEPLPPDHALWSLDNCLITPHMGGHTPAHWPRLASIVSHNLRALSAHEYGSLKNGVFVPAVYK